MKNDTYVPSLKGRGPAEKHPQGGVWPPVLMIALLPALLMLLFIGSPALAQGGQGGKTLMGPRLVLPEHTYSVESFHAGASISHDFVVRNTGDEDLQIIKIKTGCGCTVVSYPKVIPPGQEGIVTMKVFFNPAWAGNAMRQASVMETNDPRNKRVSIAISVKDLLPKEKR